jgi:hypothetical protein
MRLNWRGIALRIQKVSLTSECPFSLLVSDEAVSLSLWYCQLCQMLLIKALPLKLLRNWTNRNILLLYVLSVLRNFLVCQESYSPSLMFAQYRKKCRNAFDCPLLRHPMVSACSTLVIRKGASCFLKIIHLFTCAYIGSFLPSALPPILCPPLYALPLFPPQFQAGPVLPLSIILL